MSDQVPLTDLRQGGWIATDKSGGKELLQRNLRDIQRGKLEGPPARPTEFGKEGLPEATHSRDGRMGKWETGRTIRPQRIGRIVRIP
jgi:hypothetical protein